MPPTFRMTMCAAANRRRAPRAGDAPPVRSFAHGFTLIELMVVLVLIGIMIAIAVPSFAQFISNYRATAAVNDVLQGITLTRNEALKRGRRVTLAPIGNDWRNGWMVFVDVLPVANPPTFGAGDTLIFKHDVLPPSITVAGSDSMPMPFNNTNYVAYDGTGYAHATGGTTITGGIVVTDHTGSAISVRTLCLSNFGRPRIAPVAVGGAAQTAAACTAG